METYWKALYCEVRVAMQTDAAARINPSDIVSSENATEYRDAAHAYRSC